jgi:hypothetical protein
VRALSTRSSGTSSQILAIGELSLSGNIYRRIGFRSFDRASGGVATKKVTFSGYLRGKSERCGVIRLYR